MHFVLQLRQTQLLSISQQHPENKATQTGISEIETGIGCKRVVQDKLKVEKWEAKQQLENKTCK